MAPGRIRSKLRSSLYTFSCISTPNKAAGSDELEGSGFSRIIYCNQPHLLNYKSNSTSTTKYNVVTFFPIALFEQFNRIANVYFLIAAILSITPYGPYDPFSAIAPLAFVVGISMVKELIEDWQRFLQDWKVNMRLAQVHNGNGEFESRPWKNIMVGDIVKVEKDNFFPADLLLLSSNFDDGICYVETMNLDGETNLKVRRALETTMDLDEDMWFQDFKGTIKCEDPNPNLYTFEGELEYDKRTYTLNPIQILLRDSKLKNTSYVYGVVIFTGHDTKVMQNSTKSPSKRSRIEKQMDKIIYILFSLLVLISIMSSVGFAYLTKYDMPNWWYLHAPDEANLYNPQKPYLSGLYHLITALILYGYLIPISLYVSIEIVRVLQASFINQDIHMYHEDTDTPALARTSNLNEELGQVDTILSDKTGTLTCNQMDFLKCSIAGILYGQHPSEVEVAAVKKMSMDFDAEDYDFSSAVSGFEGEVNLGTEGTSENQNDKRQIKGFSFEDDRLTNGCWWKLPKPDIHFIFFRILAVCHTAIPEENEEQGGYNYEAESPDEGAFLVAAKEFGFQFCKRTQGSIFVREADPSSDEPVEREFKILNILDFTSKRKRMSAIVRDEKGDIFLFCKGADTIIFDRLSEKGRTFEKSTKKHLGDYGEAGLRTLVFAYKKLEEAEYKEWNNEFQSARNSQSSNKDEILEELSDKIERELILVGATAVEDKLQQGVAQCIDRLAQAGLKIWVLTGDKMETAINIGFSCSLLREEMQQICISIKDMAENESEQNIKSDILKQIMNGSQMIKQEEDPHAAYALIIDGKALTFALDDDLKHQFLHLAVSCASVICCRVSPKQKALVVRLVKEGTGKITLAIGDGANDVGMIQEADIGIGISGVEGMQAVMSSDFAIAQFKYLERLLVVHGHWFYKRIAQMICYFFYKNIAFGLTLFYYEICTAFSGNAVYDSWYMILYNVAATSLPVITLGVLEQDVSSQVCLEFPALYQQGSKNLFFGWYRIIGWICNGVYTSFIIFFHNVLAFYNQAFRVDGQMADMSIVGATMFTGIVCAVNFQIALALTHFTQIQHIFIWGSIVVWFLFLIIYGALVPETSTGSYNIFIETLAPSPLFWVDILLVIIACNLPYFIHTSFQRTFDPMDHHIIQEIKYYKKDVTDRHMWRREKRKGRHEAKIGFSARVDAKIRHLKGRIQKRGAVLAPQEML
ncbi:Phospholipid-transporting ATPase [Heracleum sosnowskyi]|uniref:Phospholipid-transporting ATPase n=1 Tax=Heracleum sosnowskyi TaxID=360622 RepID=A0AAD8HMW1_9APIA|nr:Phospholipid-transporting ATPase [Heracleum sosnowskyi]